MEEGADELAVPGRVRCTVCGLEIEEAEAQAQRWGYWQVAVDLYPFCPECAVREFAPLGSPPQS